ncbi:tetratricopeptide repeat-containing sulfotransferase family protein [Altererythrobacter sp. MF3-039]|uniref:tetratricopeptide repeat-containing sulfotransferase family protein n=1 Tax=Altererythrobacter sp. MF3-039 TaxID=3252901 RepID=UPI00390CBC0F
MTEIAGSWDENAVRDLQSTIAELAHAPVELANRLAKISMAYPDFLPARRMQARALRHIGNTAKASTVELAAVRDGLLRQSFVDAEKHFLAGDLEGAEVLIRKHLKRDPEDPAAALMLGEIASRCGARQEAENLFRRAIVLVPTYVEARESLAKLQRDQGKYEESLATIESLLDIDQKHLAALSLRAALCEQLRKFDEADRAFEELHRIHPEDARGYANHAFLLKTIGRQEDAVEAYRKSLRIEPMNGLAWWGLSNLKTVEFDHNDVASIREALESEGLEAEDRIHLQFALGKALDDLEQYASAFQAYSIGAKARLEQVPYDPARIRGHVDKNQSVFNKSFFNERNEWGTQAKDPVFIVSLPRSGSTLVEQILASHPQIEGTEELHDIERMAISLDPNGSTGSWLDVLPHLTQEQAREMGEHYIEYTRRVRHTNRPMFTDKMPSNWVFIGLIRTILPNARIIDVRRHPLGCGFANFSQHFNWGINFSYDLEHIGEFYREYVRQLAHFDEVLPGRIHRVIYEDLVQDTETVVRDLLDYIGLPFDEACLNFFKTKRAVYTPSSEQVRSPINREGMERWKNYEPFLGPLKDALGDVLTSYPDVPLSLASDDAA